MKSDVETSKDSPIRTKDGKPVPRKIYELHAEEATNKLTEFLSAVPPAKRISVMYFDEAHKLGSHFWIFLSLVQYQLSHTKLWYTFIATKSSISDYGPRPTNRQSALRLLAHI
jgi:hypothetical protein